MEEELYTTEEKQLLGLMEVMDEFFKNTTEEAPEDLERIEVFMKKSEGIKDQVMLFAKERYEDNLLKNELEEKKFKNYYNLTCTKCNFYSSYQPVGTQKDKHGYSFYTFKCVKCDAVFMAPHPYPLWEMIAFHERFIKNAAKRDRTGKILSMKVDMTEEVLAELEKDTENLKETYQSLREAEKNCDVNVLQQSLNVKHHIVNFLKIKKVFIDEPPLEVEKLKTTPS